MPADAGSTPLLSFSSRQSRTWFVWSAAVALSLFVGLIDFRTGYEVNVVLFYSVPILLMVWFADRTSAIFIALFCTLIWWWVDESSGHRYTVEQYRLWEISIRLFYFLLFVVVGSTLKSRLELLERSQYLEQEIIRISEREQQRIGRDLHDGICQYFAAIGCAAGSLKRNLEKQGAPQAGRAGEIEELIMKGVAQTRGLARGLFPVENDPAGLQSALRELAAHSTKLLNLQCTFECDERAPIFDNVSATHLYRIAQESVSNASRHGAARSVNIRLSATPREVSLSITDDGVGLAGEVEHKDGMGLGIMHYRARLIGAKFEIAPRPAGGTVVRCFFTHES